MEEAAATTSSAGELAKAEYAKILGDPSHAMYEPLRRGDARAEQYVNDLYRRAYGNAIVNFSEGITIESSRPTTPQSNADPLQTADPEALTPEARMAAMEFDSTLRSVLGDGYDEEMSAMRLGSARLFGTAEAVKAFDALTPIITELGPHAEIAVVRFLSQIGRLSHN